MKQDRTKQYIDFASGIIILGLFAVCVLAVVLTGAGVTGRISARDSASTDMRVCAGYITNRVMSARDPSAIYIDTSLSADGGVLCIPETVDGVAYLTCVYCIDGTVREFFSPADYYPPLSAGNVLTDADSLTFDISDGLLTANIDLGGGNVGRSIVCLSPGGGYNG